MLRQQTIFSFAKYTYIGKTSRNFKTRIREVNRNTNDVRSALNLCMSMLVSLRVLRILMLRFLQRAKNAANVVLLEARFICRKRPLLNPCYEWIHSSKC